MVFQTPLQTSIIKTKHDKKALIFHQIFGINITIQKILNLYDEILDECLGFYYSNNDHENLQFRTNFDISTVHKKLIERMDQGCFGDSQHVRLINLRKEWPNLRPILAAAVGVKYIDKLEKVVDYRVTVQIIELILVSVGNFNIQKNTLAAFSPLLPSAGKSNYTQSILHFFGILEQYSKLEEKLQVAGSFKVSEDRFRHFMAFDETLEIFGVKFIKQNVTELFLNEYLHKNTFTNYEQSTNLRKDEMWSLVEKLLIAFDTKDFNHYNQTHDLFYTSYPKEIHADGIRRLKECYKQELHRIHLIYFTETLNFQVILF
ncbi:hypothetical protein C1646_750018 [Rhizophagus diaphanus]|nr:hypothetical protein C1646_750018 [Rhizophagus diaphanus] [Rhizophagus sp. MUCL 43196]